MESTPENRMLFYKCLGNLFYAIAAADRAVRPEELLKLNNQISTEWAAEPENGLAADSAAQIEVVFKELVKQHASPELCFAAFILFKKQNESLFTDNLKRLIWKTANEIAAAFRNKNKSELGMLYELSIVLKS